MIRAVIGAFNYTVKTMRETFRSYEKIGLIFLVPILLLVALAFMYGEQSSVIPVAEDENIFNIGVINRDNSFFSQELKNQFAPYITPLSGDMNITGDPLETSFGECFIENINMSNRLLSTSETRRLSIIAFDNINEAKTAVQSRFVSLCFIITENFSRTMLAGVNYRTNVTRGIIITKDPDLVRSEATIELIGDYTYARFSKAENILAKMLKNFVQGYTGIEVSAGKFEIDQQQINSIEFTEFHTYIPGFLVFVILLGVSGSAAILADERASGTLDRLKLGAYSPFSLLMGLSITQTITTGLQVAVYFITVYLLGFPGKGNPVLALLISLLTLPPILGIGLISAVLVKDKNIAMSIPGLGAIPMSFLSGAFLPLPKVVLLGEIQIWHLNPLYCMSEAVRKILFLNYNLAQVSPEIILMLFIGSIIFLVCALLFYKRAYRSD
ncbi:MAG: ABC transporter permease [Candidatus Hermodarchaeota archaeon]